MNNGHYDLIAIGSGSAARDGANKAAKEYGAKVALMERQLWGGSCPNVACVPTKAYLVAADLLHDINALANPLGIEVGPATANLAKVRARMEMLKKQQPKWIEALQSAGFDTDARTASFIDAHTIRVGDTELTADKIPRPPPARARPCRRSRES
jgi:pyruvate/2-oxoglutarate dehydrogenase complex dihydrolipoamide dehydrogenase (E3) component